MHMAITRFVARNGVFAWIALASCILLVIPFIAMQLTAAIRWGVGDFVTMGGLLFAVGSALVLVARKVRPGRRWMAGALVVAVFLYVWAELAVGIFTDLGN